MSRRSDHPIFLDSHAASACARIARLSPRPLMNQPIPAMGAMAQRCGNGALFDGSVVMVLAILRNFPVLYALNFPGQGLLPWISLALPAISVVFFIVALKRAFGQPEMYRGKILGSILGVLSVLLFAGSILLFQHLKDLPKSAAAPQVGQKAPDFTLNDTGGKPVSLSQLLATPIDTTPGKAPKAVLLVFYRRYWRPFCNLEPRGLQESLQRLHDAAIRPIAIRLGTPEVS